MLLVTYTSTFGGGTDSFSFVTDRSPKKAKVEVERRLRKLGIKEVAWEPSRVKVSEVLKQGKTHSRYVEDETGERWTGRILPFNNGRISISDIEVH